MIFCHLFLGVVGVFFGGKGFFGLVLGFFCLVFWGCFVVVLFFSLSHSQYVGKTVGSSDVLCARRKSSLPNVIRLLPLCWNHFHSLSMWIQHSSIYKLMLPLKRWAGRGSSARVTIMPWFWGVRVELIPAKDVSAVPWRFVAFLISNGRHEFWGLLLRGVVLFLAVSSLVSQLVNDPFFYGTFQGDRDLQDAFGYWRTNRTWICIIWAARRFCLSYVFVIKHQLALLFLKSLQSLVSDFLCVLKQTFLQANHVQHF